MPPRIPQAVDCLSRQRRALEAYPKSTCIFCKFHAGRNLILPSSRRARGSRFPTIRARFQSTVTSPSDDALVTPLKPKEALIQLRQTLFDLQRDFQSYVNLSRVQLALRGLEQQRGKEVIRIAIVGAGEQGQPLDKVRRLVRLLVADPLKEEEDWERTLGVTDGRPVLIRIGEDRNGNEAASGFKNDLLKEINVSSPTLNSHRLEILVLETDVLSDDIDSDSFTDAILVPKIDIPTSSTGRYTPISTPVHKALLIGDGIRGAASILKLPSVIDDDIITTAVDLPGSKQLEKDLPFQKINVSLAEKALSTFRESVSNAMTYEHEWFASGLPTILDWLKKGSFETSDSTDMKPPVKALVLSILEDAENRLQMKEAEEMAALLSAKVSTPTLELLRNRLQLWAERAHTELRDQLDIAFEGKRWRKLSWWKLFWRVDDVEMIAVDILNQRFLLESEKEIIYLSGQIDGADVFKDIVESERSAAIPDADARFGSHPRPPTFSDLREKSEDSASLPVVPQPWPLHIPSTRAYLTIHSVPALQALGQKLMMQTLTTSGLSTALGGLVYMSTISTGIYEAGGVALFGIVWSLSRFQKKWETARKYWEGEVREEGRKSVRAVEGVVGDILSAPTNVNVEGEEEREKARQMIERARKMLDIATKRTSS